MLFFIVISRLVKYLLWILVLSIRLNIYCQEPVFKQYTTREGLPSNEAHFVFSDSKGYVWTCTDGGIARYNANDFRIFSTSNGMPDNTVFEAKEDNKGRVWFRTLANKLGYIFNDSVYNIGANEILPSFVHEGKIISFGFDSNDMLYVGKQNDSAANFLKIHPPYGRSDAELLKGSGNFCGMNIMILDNKTIVFSEERISLNGMSYQLRVFDQKRKLLISDTILHTETLPVTHFCSLGNDLFYASKNTLTKYNLENKTAETRKLPFQILGIAISRDSLLMIGGYSKGIYYYDINLEPVLGNLLAGSSPTSFDIDFQNGLWVSTLESGIYYHAYNDIIKYRVEQEKEAKLSAIGVIGNNRIIVGCDNGSLYEFSGINSRNVSQRKIPGHISETNGDISSVTAIVPISSSKVLVSDRLENWLYDLDNAKKLRVTHLKQSFKSGMRFNDQLIIYSVSDVFAMDTSCFANQHLGKIADRISGAAVWKNELVIAGLKGLYKYNSKTKAFENSRLVNVRIDDIVEHHGRLFLATKRAGLIILDEKGIDTISEKQGLLSNICKSVLVGDGEIWAVSNRGISKITDRGNGKYDVFNYSMDYFVDLVDIRKLHRVGDMLLFYSGNSVYSFNTKIKKPEELCSIVKISADGELKDKEKEIILPYDTKEIKIAFEALFYNLKGKILYRYNYGANWVYTSENEISLASLAPGKYNFRVEALNVNNEWVPVSDNIVITIRKPFWQTAAFILVGGVLLLMILSLLFYNINRRLLRREKLKNEITRRMLELESQAARSLMGPHFIFNSLNTLQRFILEADLENAENYLSKFSKMLRKILENSVADKISLYDEVDILNKYIDIERLRFEKSFDFKVELNVADPRFINIPFMFIQPFVENAIWHGLIPRKGNKWLSIIISKKDEKRIRCIVEDNGVGRQSGMGKTQLLLKEKSLAMDIIRQRLELLTKAKEVDCYYEITDKRDENGNSTGTRIEIVLPIIN